MPWTESFLPPPLGSAGIGCVTPNSIREQTSQVGMEPEALGPEEKEVQIERDHRDKASTELMGRGQTRISALDTRAEGPSVLQPAGLLLCMCLQMRLASSLLR